MSDVVVVDDLELTLSRSARRATIGITVERDGSLSVAAPMDAPVADIESVVRDKQFWIYRKLAEKSLLRQHESPTREFVNGEGFYYLGRSHQLRLIKPSADETPPLRLYQGRFQLRRDCEGRAQDHFISWYQAHGRRWYQHYIWRYADRIGVSPAGLKVQNLGYRWGSCGKGDVLYFHWRTICLPPRIVEYVVVHELVHLHESHHSPEFWRGVERAMPDYSERERWLAENGKRFIQFDK